MIEKLKEIKNYLYNLKGISEQKKTVHALSKNGKVKLHNVASNHNVTFNGNSEVIAIIEQDRYDYAAVLPSFSTTPVIKDMRDNDSTMALLKEDGVNLYDVVKLKYKVDSEDNFNKVVFASKTKNLKGIQTTNLSKKERLAQWEGFTRETRFTEEELQNFATKFKELQNQYNTFLSEPTSNWGADVGYWIVDIATDKSKYSFPLNHLQDIIEDWATKVDKLKFPKPKAENVGGVGGYLHIVYEFREQIRRAAHRPTEIKKRLDSIDKDTWMKESEREHEIKNLNQELINIPTEAEAIKEALRMFDKEVGLQNSIYNTLKEFCSLVNVDFTALMKNQHSAAVICGYSKGSVFTDAKQGKEYEDFCQSYYGSLVPKVLFTKSKIGVKSNIDYIKTLLSNYDSDYLTQTKYMRRLIGKTQQDFEKLFG